MKSNLDIARECGAAYVRQWDCNEILHIKFTPAQLDVFAERILANHLPDDGGMISEAALSHTINQASCAIADGTEPDLIRAIGKALWRQWQAQRRSEK